MKIGNIEISTEDFNALTEQGLTNLQALANVKARKTANKKSSINGAPKDLEGVEVVEKEGVVYFKHKAYKTRSKPVADLITAKGLIETQQFASTNKKTGVSFVEVDGKPVGENLVLYAEQNKLL